MGSRLWGIPPIVAGLVAIGVVLAIGWTCPTGGSSLCPHAYIAGWWVVVLGAGALLVLAGIALIVAGGKRPPR